MERLRELPVGMTVGDAYRLVRRIGDGALGTVYQAQPLRGGAPCALKIINGAISDSVGELARFHSQAEMATRISHPHLVRVFDFGTVDSGEPFLAMEYLEGEDLAQRLRRVKRVEPPRVTFILKQVASALEALHKQGLSHLDLKPTNLLLLSGTAEHEFVKVLDFATAQVENARHLNHASALVDSLPYVAPEQSGGADAPLDDRCDQWALACIAWQMLTGRAPFAGEDATALLYQIAYEEPVGDPETPVPAAILEVLRTALAKRPEQRFPNMSELVQAFEAVAGTLPPVKRKARAAGRQAQAAQAGQSSHGTESAQASARSAAVFLPGVSPRGPEAPRKGRGAHGQPGRVATRLQGLRVRSASGEGPGSAPISEVEELDVVNTAPIAALSEPDSGQSPALVTASPQFASASRAVAERWTDAQQWLKAGGTNRRWILVAAIPAALSMGLLGRALWARRAASARTAARVDAERAPAATTTAGARAGATTATAAGRPPSARPRIAGRPEIEQLDPRRMTSASTQAKRQAAKRKHKYRRPNGPRLAAKRLAAKRLARARGSARTR